MQIKMYIIAKLRWSRWLFLGVVLFASQNINHIIALTWASPQCQQLLELSGSHPHTNKFGTSPMTHLLAITIIPMPYLNLHVPLAVINAIFPLAIAIISTVYLNLCNHIMPTVTWTLDNHMILQLNHIILTVCLEHHHRNINNVISCNSFSASKIDKTQVIYSCLN